MKTINWNAHSVHGTSSLQKWDIATLLQLKKPQVQTFAVLGICKPADKDVCALITSFETARSTSELHPEHNIAN